MGPAAAPMFRDRKKPSCSWKPSSSWARSRPGMNKAVFNIDFSGTPRIGTGVDSERKARLEQAIKIVFHLLPLLPSGIPPWAGPQLPLSEWQEHHGRQEP